jgi:hypothetical protein
MPFVFSHPAIILPLTYLPRRWYSLTGLIIGSLAPDFEYFIRMRILSNYSHTISGLLWFDLPLGLILAFIFHDLVRESLFENLPTILKSRFTKFNHYDWNKNFKNNWHIIIISILIGAVSHLFWDSFTHHQGYFVKIIPILKNNVDIANKQIPIFKILQHFSTFIGVFVIAFSIWKLPRDNNVKGRFHFKYWSLITCLTLLIIIIRFLIGLDVMQFGHLIVTSISAVMISILVTSILSKIKIYENRTYRPVDN